MYHCLIRMIPSIQLKKNLPVSTLNCHVFTGTTSLNLLKPAISTQNFGYKFIKGKKNDTFSFPPVACKRDACRTNC